MSTTSSKQRYAQLMEWLGTIKKTEAKGATKKQSRLDYYKTKGN